jgi:hypothetical protein
VKNDGVTVLGLTVNDRPQKSANDECPTFALRSYDARYYSSGTWTDAREAGPPKPGFTEFDETAFPARKVSRKELGEEFAAVVRQTLPAI